ncbi:MAG: ABC transporter ATP-binding protein [Oscillospiraceae bacterium]|nr:ABC transporter ATP-binding protein [Oscillospiraceae bacterium]
MIVYKSVRKTYGNITAVRDLNMAVQQGEFFGLLGPNGAGKTTIIRMTMALTPPTSGSIEIGGQKIRRDSTEIKQKFGIVPQYSNLENDLTAYENLEFHGRLYGLSKQLRRRRIDELLEFADLTGRKNDIARSFSGGMQRKLMIAKTLMHDPEIMLLDEPTVGLDATTRRKIWDFLRQLRENGLTIFMTTHYLEEAQALCERVGLIDEGALIMLDTPERIIESSGRFVLDCFQGGKTTQEFFEDRASAIAAAGQLEGGFKVREANLEDAFIKLTNKDLGVRHEI